MIFCCTVPDHHFSGCLGVSSELGKAPGARASFWKIVRRRVRILYMPHLLLGSEARFLMAETWQKDGPSLLLHPFCEVLTMFRFMIVESPPARTKLAWNAGVLASIKTGDVRCAEVTGNSFMKPFLAPCCLIVMQKIVIYNMLMTFFFLLRLVMTSLHDIICYHVTTQVIGEVLITRVVSVEVPMLGQKQLLEINSWH